ncbi:MAG TPA: potassium transporter TrkA, partial [Thiotrichales bacterium]|nr:potassium transporter TrkA [Thiotrichales bacterium]
MNQVTSITLRRMRVPFLVLITVYSISILGMVLIPGVDDNGNAWHMSFFHAFYFVSYTATTIGFGEIPYPLTDAQRLWVLITIYITVIAWFYALGKIIALVQDKTFQDVSRKARFSRQVKAINRPFFLICGLGETGKAVVSALTEEHYHAVAVDQNADNINELAIDELKEFVPSITGDASDPKILEIAGIRENNCRGVIAVTASDETNLKIAITSKLLHPDVSVICRSELKEYEENMLSFDTNYIVNPFETFADIFAMALQSPSLHLIYDWLTGAPSTSVTEPIFFGDKNWILIGYGRFGKELYTHLRARNIPTTVIDPSTTAQQDFLSLRDTGDDRFILGTGTDAATLKKAGIEQASGLIAGSDNDSNNLSSIMTARAINRYVFIVARQNQLSSEALYSAINKNYADYAIHAENALYPDTIAHLVMR